MNAKIKMLLGYKLFNQYDLYTKKDKKEIDKGTLDYYKDLIATFYRY